MMIALVVALIALALLGAGFALLPLRRASSAALPAKSERDELRDELNAALMQIGDLERMRAAGDLDASDFERLKQLDEARAARLLGQIESLPEPVSSQPVPARPAWRGAALSLAVVAVVLGGISALAVPSLQRLALREGEAELYDQSNQLLALEGQLSREAAGVDGQPKLATLLEYGAASWELQQWERAAQAYGAILRLDPSNIKAVSRYGQLVFFSGDNDQALTLLRAAAKFNDAEALLTIGNILFSAKNDPKGALAIWEQYQRVTKGKGEARVIELIAAAKKRVSSDDIGATTFATNCAGCHAANGAGIAGTAPSLKSSSSARDATFIKNQLANGSSNKQMPAFPGIKGAQLEALVKHVQSLKP
jgi:mono/diheme cytochrome c family protein